MQFPWLQTAFDALMQRRERLPHALLLSGPPGIGKSALAQTFAQALLCESPGTAGACGRCMACGWFAAGNHPDHRRVTLHDEGADERDDTAASRTSKTKSTRASREIRIEQIRALSGFLGVGSHRGGRRIVEVDPADALNAVSANALLKTLEEPGENVHFLLVTSHAQGVPATIRSRCVQVQLPPPDPQQALRWLKTATGVDDAQAADWLAVAGGSPLLAAGFADADRAAVHRLIVDTLARLPDTDPMTAAETLATLPPTRWIVVLQAWVGDVARLAAGAEAARFPSEARRLKQLAERSRLDRIGRFSAWLDRQRSVADHPLNPRLYCEDTLIRYCRLWTPDSPS